MLDTVVSGIRPTGFLHIGHYYGIIKNWVKLQNNNHCLFFIADYHALTTNFNNIININFYKKEIILDLLASGINPSKCIIFLQSNISEYLELYLILSMLTPLNLLKHNPVYNDLKNKLKNINFGLLSYPLLQASDILIYNAKKISIGKDQIPHIEIIYNILNKINFNFYSIQKEKIIIYSKNINFLKYNLCLNLLDKFINNNKKKYINKIKHIIIKYKKINLKQKNKLFNLFIINRILFFKPKIILSKNSYFLGIDGKKMSKSANNYINIRENLKSIKKKIFSIKTDINRIYIKNFGNPYNCIIWNYHIFFSNKKILNIIYINCKNGNIGCIDCKEFLLQYIIKKRNIFVNNINKYSKKKFLINSILEHGCSYARLLVKKNIRKIKKYLNI